MRKTSIYTVTEENRDKGKVFQITEMSAAEAEQWAIRAFFALMNAGVDIPDEIASMGFAGFAAMNQEDDETKEIAKMQILGLASVVLGALGRVPYPMAKPLLDDMMDCVKIIPDPSKPQVVRALMDIDIEEVSTRLKLRKSVFDLHIDFLEPAALSTMAQTAAA
jgi:hypothetical protein